MKDKNGFYKINDKNSFFFSSFIVLYILCICDCILIGKYPYLKKLNNDRYILISNKGITFLDPTLSDESNSIVFEEDVYPEINYIFSTSAVQFPKEDNNLIFALINDILYIFDSNETLLNNQTIISEQEYSFSIWTLFYKPYYLYPYKREDNIYTTIFLSVTEKDGDFIYLSLQNILYDKINNIISLSDKVIYNLHPQLDASSQPTGNSIGCSLLNYNNSKILNCIYGISDFFNIINFNPEDNYKADIRLTGNITRNTQIYFFKSLVLPGNEQVIYCSFFLDKSFDCIKYDIVSNTYNFFHKYPCFVYIPEAICDFQYFEESEQILLLFFGYNDFGLVELYVHVCDLEGNCSDKKYESIGGVSDLKDIYSRANFVIPKGKLTYYLFVYDENIDKYDLDLGLEFELKCKIYYNYNKTFCLDELPEGYFCNNTEEKTIDKCHINCKTCNATPTNNNNNCLTCKQNNNIYYDLGNCVENCSNSYFLDDIHNLTCKCTSNIECFLCSENGLCKSCNKEEGYYQKIDEENINGFVNCYKNPQGYYLLNDIYYPCYSSCKYCIEKGNETNHKCTECKSEFEFKLDFENDNNCYEICEHYYYFDDNNNYHCTLTDNCPSEYSKLIPEQKKCIKDNDIFSEIVLNSSFILANQSDIETKCKINDFLLGQCNYSLNVDIQIIINQIRNIITSNENEIDYLLKDIRQNGKVITKKIEKVTLQLIKLDNQTINNKLNTSIIDFGECESILKNNYNIKNESILLFKIDFEIEGYSTIIVEYELYNPYNNSKLNLEYCNQSFIDIYVPAFINSKDINIYNPLSEFYNDFCSPHTNEDGADVILLDRKNEFVNNNMTLCDDDCEFKGYDSINNKSICKCRVKYYMEELSNIDSIDSEKFFKNWVNIENYINLRVMKCYKLLSTKDGFLINIGNFFLLTIIFLNIVSVFYFYFKGYPKLNSEIMKLKNDVTIDLKYNLEIVEEKRKEITVVQNDNNQKTIKLIKLKKMKGKNRKTYIPNRRNKLSVINSHLENKNSNAIIISSQNQINKVSDSEKRINSDTGKKDINSHKKNLNDYELNSLNYKDALELDKRTYLEYYWSLLKTKQLIIFTFYFMKDYNSYIIKIELFLFAISLYLIVSALFFNDDTIHKIYDDDGIFNFIYNIPQIIYSTLISAVINVIVKTLSLTESKILEIKQQKSLENLDIKVREIQKKLKLKFILFYIISGIFLILFWFYISCFCAVYRNTQYHLIKDTFISFSLSLFYPFVINLIPICIRIPAIQNKNSEYIYKISKVIQLI